MSEELVRAKRAALQRFDAALRDIVGELVEPDRRDAAYERVMSATAALLDEASAADMTAIEMMLEDEREQQRREGTAP